MFRWIVKGRRLFVGLVVTVVAGVSALAGYAVASHEGGAIPPRPAFLARGDNPVDALAASSVAGAMGGVVLLTPTNNLSQQALDGLDAYDPGIVVLAGGPAAISTHVEQQVEDAGYRTLRVAGASRYDTARELANFLNAYGVGRPLVTTHPDADVPLLIEGDANLAGHLDVDRLTVAGQSVPSEMPITTVEAPFSTSGQVQGDALAVVECPPGYVAIAGGFDVDRIFDVGTNQNIPVYPLVNHQSGRNGELWVIQVQAEDRNRSPSGTGQAICALP